MVATTKKATPGARRGDRSRKDTTSKGSSAPMDMRLRRITAEVLEQLKYPNAIPSKIIYAALERAAKAN